MRSESDVWPDAMHTRCETTFGYWDRVRVLLGWRLQLRLRTPVAVVIPACGDTTSTSALVAPRWWRRLFPLKPVALSHSEGP